MNKFSLLPILRALGDARTIRKIMTLILQAFAIASLLIGVYFVVQFIRGMSQGGATTESTIAGILAILLLSAMCLAMAQIFWLRAGNVQNVPEGPYLLIPLASLFIRAMGEVYAAVYATMGLLGCLFLWITKANPWEAAAPGFLPVMTDQNAFLAGLLFLVRCSLGSGLALLIGYFIAEVVLAALDIVVHVRMTAGQSPTAPSPYTAVPQFPAPAAPQYHSPMPHPDSTPQYPAAAPPYPGSAPQYPGSPAPQYSGAAPPQYPATQGPQYPAPAAPQYPGAPPQQYQGPPATQYPAAMPPQQPAPVSPRCPVCGTDVTPGAPFCGRCGNPLTGRAPGY
jgi:zinc-ribbon domain